MRNYENMLVFSPEIEKETIKSLIEDLTALIEDNDGEVTTVDEWGMRELAYEINDLNRGYYAVAKFAGTNDVLDKLDKFCKFNEGILRYLILKDE